MKHLHITILLAVLMSMVGAKALAIETNNPSGVILNSTNFPDAIFRAKISNLTGVAENGTISEDKLLSVNILSVDQCGITSLKGVEFFTALTELVCYGNQLTSLDVSKNTALAKLWCSNNQLSVIDVSKNTALKTLYCYGNQLTSLDISKNTALTTLWCSNDQLTNLDVSKNAALKYLDCSYSLLTSLDVSKNTALTELYCSYNHLTCLYLSKNTQLAYKNINHQSSTLSASSNGNLYSINVGSGVNGSKISEFKVDGVSVTPSVQNGVLSFISSAKPQVITYMYDTDNSVAGKMGVTINVNAPDAPVITGVVLNSTNFPDATFRAYISNLTGVAENDIISEEKLLEVEAIQVPENSVSSLKGIEFFSALTDLYCYYNNLTSLDVSHNTALRVLQCYHNKLTSLNVSKNTSLIVLSCGDNQLTSLDVSKNTVLQALSCGGNQLAGLNVSNNTALQSLNCGYNQLTSLDVSNNTALTTLQCGGNQLTNLNVSKNTALNSLYCGANQLTSIDVTNNTALRELYSGDNQLTTLDVSMNTALGTLHCENNLLTRLDVTNNNLGGLYCANNMLTSLDVSQNTYLGVLDCAGNQLTNLNVTQNTYLNRLNCNSNQLTNLNLSNCTRLQSGYCDISTQTLNLFASSNGNMYSINVGTGVNGSKISEFKVDGVSVTPSVQNGVLSFSSSAKPQVITYMYDTDNSVAGKMDVTINVSISDENADTDISQMDNVVYIDRTEVKTGGQAVLSIKMKNSAPIRGFQFDLYLPNGVTAAKNSKGRIVASLSSGRLGDDDEHTLTTAEQADGGIRFLSSSLYDENFMGNDGEIVSLTVNVAEDMEDGDYPLEIKNARLTETDISRYYITDYVKSTLAVSSYMLGDINADDEVDVRDYTGVANHIMGNTPEGFVMKAGDIDENGEIDVRDYTGIANIIMTSTIGSNHSPVKRSMDKMKASAPVDLSSLDNVAYVADATITAGTQTDLSICMKNSAPIRGFQFDLYLPEGVTVAKTEKGRIIASLSSERLDVDDEHTLITEEQSDGAIRFLCSSLYDENFTGNEGEIASLKVNVSEDAVSGDYTVLLKNIILTETDISKYYKTDEIESVLTIEDKGDGRLHFDESSATLPNYTVGEKANVAMKRKLTAGNWSTIVLPFTLTKEKAETVFGSDMQLAEFSGFSTEYSDDNDVIPDAIQIHFSTYTMTARKNMTGGKLFLIKTAKDMESFEADEVTLANAVTDVSKADEWGTNGKFTGSLVKTIVPENGLFINDNKFWYSTGQTNIKAFRGWFELGAVLNKNTNFSAKIAFFIDNEETSIEGLTKGARLDGAVYTLNGQLVGRNLSDKNLQKGVYIRNGKKFVVK